MEDRRQLHIQRGLTPSEIPPKKIIVERTYWCPACWDKRPVNRLEDEGLPLIRCLNCGNRMLVIRTMRTRT